MSQAAANEASAAMLQHALAIIAKVPGARVFPIKAGAKFPPLIKDWPSRASGDPAKLEEWWSRWPDANIGVTGPVIADVDVRDDKQGVASMKALGIPADELRRAMVVDTPSGGMHLYFSPPQGARVPSVNGFREGLDIKADGGYVLGPGSCLLDVHGKEIGRYEIAPDFDHPPGACPGKLVELLADRQHKPERHGRDVVAAGAELDAPEMAARAVDWLTNEAPAAVERQGGDQCTFNVACELRDMGLSEVEAFIKMLDHYNDRCDPPWNDDDLRHKVANAFAYGQNPAGAKTPGALHTAAADEFREVNIPPLEHKPRQRGEWFYQHGDPIVLDTQWLFFERFPRVGTAMIVGPSGGGKSFYCADLARAVAKREASFGVEPDERGGAAILVAEGVAGTPRRLSILSEEPLPIWAEPIANLRSTEEKRRIFDLLDDAQTDCLERFGFPIRLIVIDTMAQSGLVLDENSASESAQAVKFLEQLASRYSCLVAVTHHPPKNGTGARGSGAFHAGFDVVVQIEYEVSNPVRTVECIKGRDAPTGRWGFFKLIPVHLGFDEKLREMTTCSLELVDGPGVEGGVFLDPATADALNEAISEARLRYDHRSPEAVTHVIARCLGLDHATPFGRKQATAYCEAMVGGKYWVKSKDMIKGRGVFFVEKARGGSESAQSAQSAQS